MDIYTILWLLIVFALFTNYKNNTALTNKYFWLIAVLMIILVAFRADDIGGDTFAYRKIFQNPDIAYSFGENEILLTLINKIIRFIWNDVYFASIVKALLILVPMFVLYYTQSSNIIFSLFLFATYSYGGSMYFLTYSAERQCIAMAFFCIFLILYTNKEKYSNIQLLTPLVCMFLTHTSSVFTLLLFPFIILKLNKRIILGLTIISLFTGFIIGDYISTLFAFADSYDKGFYFSNYGNYNTNYLMLLPFYLPYYIALYYWPKNKINNIYFAGFTLCIILTAFLQTIGQNIERMSAYYYICAFIAIPQAYTYISNKKVRLFYILFILLYFSRKYFLILEIMTEVENGICPYKSFL